MIFRKDSLTKAFAFLVQTPKKENQLLRASVKNYGNYEFNTHVKLNSVIYSMSFMLNSIFPLFMKYACILMKNIQKKTIRVQDLYFIKVKF